MKFSGRAFPPSARGRANRMDCAEYRARYPEFAKLPLPREVCETPEWMAWMEHVHDCRGCSDWDLGQRVIARGAFPDRFPCVHIAEQVTKTCSEHPDADDCPDKRITYFPRFDEYLLLGRKGGADDIAIRHCPWCGVAVPESKRGRWFRELLAMGCDPAQGEIPVKYMTDEWYRTTTA